MAVNMFLKVDGIKGESKDAKHKDEIDVLSWSWGMASPPPPAGGGGGGGAGKVSFQDVSIGKRIDAATPPLMLSCASGQHIKSALLTARKAGAASPEYLTIKMDDVLVTSVAVGEPGPQGGGTETVTLNFGKVALDYFPQKAAGGTSPPISFKWDVTKNAKL
jgi:type VI secretion system secreted protein Hcp